MKRRKFLQLLTAGSIYRLLPVSLRAFPGATSKNVKAIPTQKYLDSIGVAVHWNYPDTPYGYAYNNVRDLLIDSGIQHVRDGLSDRIQDLADHHIKSTIVADLPNNADGTRTDIEQLHGRIKKENENRLCIDGVEGPNEPDLFWERFKKSYNGNGFRGGQDGIIQGVTDFQKDLFEIIKSDPDTEMLTVLGIALGKTYDPGAGLPNPFNDGELTDYVDWGNFHPYPGGGNPFSYPYSYAGIEKYYWQSNFPSINLDEYAYAFNTYHPPYAPKPMACTETGWSSEKNGISERTHGKYIPRLFAEYFRLGIQRTFIYEFIDEFKDPDQSNPEANYGLVRRDLTPKPGYVALQSLIQLLQDATADFEPGSLDFRLHRRSVENYNKVQFVHHLLLQKSNGDFYMLLWHEISAEDISINPHRQLEHPDMPVELMLNEPVSRATLYRYDDNNQFQHQSLEINDGSITFTVPDEIVVLQLSKQDTGVNTNKISNRFQLYHNYPNPFNPSTMISYHLPASEHVLLEVFDVCGRHVKTLVNKTQDAGPHSVRFVSDRLASGVFYYRLKAGRFCSTKRMTRMK